MLKNKILKALDVCQLGFFALAGLTCIGGAGGASLYYDVKLTETRSQNEAGYEEFNGAFKQSQIDALTEKLNNNEISPEQFANQSTKLEDYSFEDYMLKQTTPQAAREYSQLVSQSHSVVQTIGCVSAAELGLAALAHTCCFAVEKTGQKKDEKQKTSSPTAANCNAK